MAKRPGESLGGGPPKAAAIEATRVTAALMADVQLMDESGMAFFGEADGIDDPWGVIIKQLSDPDKDALALVNKQSKRRVHLFRPTGWGAWEALEPAYALLFDQAFRHPQTGETTAFHILAKALRGDLERRARAPLWTPTARAHYTATKAATYTRYARMMEERNAGRRDEMAPQAEAGLNFLCQQLGEPLPTYAPPTADELAAVRDESIHWTAAYDTDGWRELSTVPDGEVLLTNEDSTNWATHVEVLEAQTVLRCCFWRQMFALGTRLAHHVAQMHATILADKLVSESLLCRATSSRYGPVRETHDTPPSNNAMLNVAHSPSAARQVRFTLTVPLRRTEQAITATHVPSLSFALRTGLVASAANMTCLPQRPRATLSRTYRITGAGPYTSITLPGSDFVWTLSQYQNTSVTVATAPNTPTTTFTWGTFDGTDETLGSPAGPTVLASRGGSRVLFHTAAGAAPQWARLSFRLGMRYADDLETLDADRTLYLPVLNTWTLSYDPTTNVLVTTQEITVGRNAVWAIDGIKSIGDPWETSTLVRNDPEHRRDLDSKDNMVLYNVPSEAAALTTQQILERLYPEIYPGVDAHASERHKKMLQKWVTYCDRASDVARGVRVLNFNFFVDDIIPALNLRAYRPWDTDFQHTLRTQGKPVMPPPTVITYSHTMGGH
jgi:hypothetical protein